MNNQHQLKKKIIEWINKILLQTNNPNKKQKMILYKQ